jgi:hypothetical protein
MMLELLCVHLIYFRRIVPLLEWLSEYICIIYMLLMLCNHYYFYFYYDYLASMLMTTNPDKCVFCLLLRCLFDIY